jgi:hypothetical protein
MYWSGGPLKARSLAAPHPASCRGLAPGALFSFNIRLQFSFPGAWSPGSRYGTTKENDMLRSGRRFGLIAVILGAALALGTTLIAQADPFMGTWALNVDKSEFQSQGAGVRARTIIISQKGNVISHVQDTYRVGNDAVSKVSYDVTYDGKDSTPVIGAAFDVVNITRMGNTLTRKAKNRGMEVETATYTVSPDGKTLTIVTKGNNYGVQYSSTQVFEKQAAGGTR